MEKIKTEQVAWNLAEHLIWEISNLLQNASNNSISGGYNKSFYNLRAIRLRITPYLDEEEKADMIRLEKRLFLALSRSTSSSFSSTEDNKNARIEVFEKYGEYNDSIMYALKRYGFLVPEKEDKTKLN